MNRKETTKFLSDMLVRDRLTGRGKYWASEVTIDYMHGKGKEKRIDFMQFEPVNQLSISGLEHGIFICYEVKSCAADFHSGNGLNFVGDKNYIVTTQETYEKIRHEIPWSIGVLVPIALSENALWGNTKDWGLSIAHRAKSTNRERSVIELLFCMLRSGRE